jgi:hypothetical protein
MHFLRAFHRSRECRWVQQKLDESFLIIKRKPDHLDFFDRTLGGFLSGGDNEVADAAALKFGGTLHDGQGVGGDSRLDPGGTAGFGWHHGTSLSGILYGNLPYTIKRLLAPAAMNQHVDADT